MRWNDFIVQAPLLLGGHAISEAEVLGASVWLWMHSAMHRDAPLHVLPSILLPIIKRQQYVLVVQRQQPVFFLSWMWLDAQAEARYLREPTVMIQEEDWRCGDLLWFRDFIAPFGHVPAMKELLYEELFSYSCARFLWHKGALQRPRIKTFHGRGVSRDSFHAWKRRTAPQGELLQCGLWPADIRENGQGAIS